MHAHELEQAPAPTTDTPRPAWDPARRELWFLGQLVKDFPHGPAPNQEHILAAFEEDGWPEQIDDPLPPVKGQNCSRRLHNAVNCLNRSHRANLIHFYAANRGAAIGWKRVVPAVSPSTARAFAAAQAQAPAGKPRRL